MIPYQELEKFYDNDNNKEQFNHTISLKSGKLNLKCDKNHKWLQRMSDLKTDKITCPYCSCRKVLTGFNDAETFYPDIVKIWDYDKNNITPQDVTYKTTKKVWWVCDKGHEYYKSVADITLRGQRCYYCSGKRVLQGFNDLATEYPKISKQWNYNKNPNDIDPTKIRKGSNKKYWWNCDNGHSYECTVTNRVQGYGCPYCYGRKAWKGENDLLSKYPELVKESWDFDKNTVKPDEVTYGSDKKVWWKCNLGHSWKSHVYSRKKGHGCPICDGKILQTGFNDVKTQYPKIAEEWDYDKNKETPDKVKSGSKNKYWFICPQGHNYQTVLEYRTKSDSGCPTCSKSRSKLEIEIFEYVKSIIPDVDIINNYKNDNISEIDIYIPDKNIGIEVNGVFWHSSKAGRKDSNKHYNKWLKCKEENIQLLTIWEDDWRNNTTLVKNMLKHKLNVSDNKKVYARNTSVCKKPVKTIKSFLSINHIQSFGVGTMNLCLSYNDDLIAVSTWIFDRKKKILTLDRYATSCIVVGGFSKLLKQGILLARELGAIKIVTYSDHEISDGKLYSKTGFINDGFIKPSYYYIQNNGRVHKSNFRKSRFKNDPLLKYEDGLTEKQLAEINCLPIVYDCGKTRWIYNIE